MIDILRVQEPTIPKYRQFSSLPRNSMLVINGGIKYDREKNNTLKKKKDTDLLRDDSTA